MSKSGKAAPGYKEFYTDLIRKKAGCESEFVHTHHEVMVPGESGPAWQGPVHEFRLLGQARDLPEATRAFCFGFWRTELGPEDPIVVLDDGRMRPDLAVGLFLVRRQQQREGGQ